jgi:Holliday junction resolvase RusA-like endonuclease
MKSYIYRTQRNEVWFSQTQSKNFDFKVLKVVRKYNKKNAAKDFVALKMEQTFHF